MNAKQLSIDVITYAKSRNCPITNLKLQKTLYYIQGYYSKYFEKPLFDDAHFLRRKNSGIFIGCE